MINVNTFRKKHARVMEYWQTEKYDSALALVESMQTIWPGNAQLSVLWACLVQLQDESPHSLSDAKKSLRRAIDLDDQSPQAFIELGFYQDKIEDDPAAAAATFAEGASVARQQLIEGLIGQAEALLQLEKKLEAQQCLIEALYLTEIEERKPGKSAERRPDVLMKDLRGRLSEFKIQGPYSIKLDELIGELANH